MAAISIVALDGDQTGQEVRRFDLSLENRRATSNGVVTEAAQAMRETGLGLKAATITPEGADDIGSPNRILREEVDGDELAHRTETIRRSDCRAVAEFAFREAERIGGRVYGGPKWTVSPVYEGMLKEEMDAAAERHPDTGYEPVLIDATLAGLVTGAGTESLVIPCLNRDGDLPSDLVLPLFGSIAGAESVLLGLDDELRTTVAMAEAPHGTAPALEGKDIANPMAMILATGALLHYAGDALASADEVDAAAGRQAEQASRAIYEGVLETVAAGTRTPDLSGHAGTIEFTDAVIELVKRKLEVWAAM